MKEHLRRKDWGHNIPINQYGLIRLLVRPLAAYAGRPISKLVYFPIELDGADFLLLYSPSRPL